MDAFEIAEFHTLPSLSRPGMSCQVGPCATILGSPVMEQSPENRLPLHAELYDSPCPYFGDERIASIEYAQISGAGVPGFGIRLAEGYRRFADLAYRTACRTCAACIPIRLRPETFIASRDQARVLKRNQDISISILETPAITAERVLLCRKYQKKHGDGGEAGETDMSLLALHYGYHRTIEMNYFLQGRLIGVGIVDEADDALSANYFYYDTDLMRRSPGTFSILTEISLALHLKKQYYYLGFYLEEIQSMCYKARFRPHEMLRNRAWISGNRGTQEQNPD